MRRNLRLVEFGRLKGVPIYGNETISPMRLPGVDTPTRDQRPLAGVASGSSNIGKMKLD